MNCRLRRDELENLVINCLIASLELNIHENFRNIPSLIKLYHIKKSFNFEDIILVVRHGDGVVLIKPPKFSGARPSPHHRWYLFTIYCYTKKNNMGTICDGDLAGLPICPGFCAISTSLELI